MRRQLKRVVTVLVLAVSALAVTAVPAEARVGTCSWTDNVIARGGGWNSSGYWISGNMYTGCDQIRAVWYYSFNVNSGATTPDGQEGFMRAKIFRSDGSTRNGPWRTVGDRTQVILINTGDVGIGVRYRIQFIPPCPYCNGDWFPYIAARD